MRVVGTLIVGVIGAFAGACVGYILPAGSWLGLSVGVLVGAVVCGGLWLRRRRALAAGFALIGLLLAGGSTVAQLYALGGLPPLTNDRAEAFDRLTSAVTNVYPYFDLKGVDWDAAVAQYRPQAVGAADDAAYFAAVAALLGELNDAHTFLDQPYPQASAWFGTLADIEGQAVVIEVSAAAQAAGLAIGDVVLTLDGRGIDQAIAALPPQLRVASTAWNARAYALWNLLFLWQPNDAISLTVRGGDDTERALTLRPMTQPDSAGGDAITIPGERLPSGIGVIRIPRFGERAGENLTAQFDAALAELADVTGLIIDVRGNGGGSSTLAMQMAGRLVSEAAVYATETTRVGLPNRFWLREGQRRVEPRGEIITMPVVLLTDALCVSTCEEFVIALVDGERAQSVGRVTGGASGNPITFLLPNSGAARISTGDLRRRDGTRVEGMGISPHVSVSWTLADVRTGRDPDMLAAEALLTAVNP